MKLGLKLWSSNTDFYYREAQKLYSQGHFDYIELYVVPDTCFALEKWQKLSIPFILHAPHFRHKVNLADEKNFFYNKEIFDQVEKYRQKLNALYTVVHLGMEGTIEESVWQLSQIQPKNFVVENKPYVPPGCPQKKCRGSTAEEILFAVEQLGCGFCLDIGHALCTANYLEQAPYAYLAKFQKLSPKMYHLSDGDINSFLDQHRHLGAGDYDMSEIFSIIDYSLPISIETEKSSLYNLTDFIADVNYIKTIIMAEK